MINQAGVPQPRACRQPRLDPCGREFAGEGDASNTAIRVASRQRIDEVFPAFEKSISCDAGDDGLFYIIKAEGCSQPRNPAIKRCRTGGLRQSVLVGETAKKLHVSLRRQLIEILRIVHDMIRIVDMIVPDLEHVFPAPTQLARGHPIDCRAPGVEEDPMLSGRCG